MDNRRQKRRSITSGEKIGKYELEEVIHSGTYRVIYRARDPFLDRKVAIKVTDLPTGPAAEDTQQVRDGFFVEAQAIGKLQHPHIVSVYDAGIGDHETYIVMELVDGNSLANLLEQKFEFSTEKIIDIGYKCCKALEYAHQQGVIHRDIKPGNILLKRDGDIKIVDFSVAKVDVPRNTHVSGIFGSPSYMSPEQVEEKEVTPQSDLFSLGVVLYQLLTHISPFYADNIHTTMYKILHDKPQPLHKFGVEHAGDLQRILDKALAKDPKKRYQSVEQFARDLTSLFDEIRYEKSRIQRRLRTGAISKLSFFKNFNLQDVDEFTNVATWVQIEQGETVLSEGEIDKTFYVIVHGCAVVDKEGSQLISLKEGDCFGEMGMLHQNQRTTAIRANSELLLMKLSASDIDKLSEHCQAQYYKAIAHSLVDRLSQSEPSLKEAL